MTTPWPPVKPDQRWQHRRSGGVLRQGTGSLGAFAGFLRAQSDLGTKWAPRFLRIAAQVPLTATRKVDRALLRAQHWEAGPAEGPVYWRRGAELSCLQRMTHGTFAGSSRHTAGSPCSAKQGTDELDGAGVV